MSDEVERKVKEFYDKEGWITDEENVVNETKLFRDLKGGRAEYGEKVTDKLKAMLNDQQGTLLIIGGGDIPEDHRRAAAHFEKILCVDISEEALKHAKGWFAERGEYHNASAMSMPFPDNHVDAILCAHMLYHVDKENQGSAINEMIRVAKPSGRILIVYVNRNSPLMIIQRFLKFLRINKLLGKDKLYVYYHDNRWWEQFADRCQVTIHPYDAISTNQAKALLPAVSLRKRFFAWASRYEDCKPKTAASLWSYISVTLDKV